MHEQPRRANGQFGETTREEAEVDLLGTPAVPQGSFLFPPIVHTAAEAIAFWERVEIPDEICMKAQSWYVSDFQRAVDEGPESAWLDGDGPLVWQYYEPRHPRPDPADTAATAAWEAEKNAWGEKFCEDLREALRSRPEYIDPRDVRQFAKVIGLIGAANTLPEAEAEKVRHEHMVELTDGPDTVFNINLRRGLFGFGEALRNPHNFDPDIKHTNFVKGIATAMTNISHEQRELLLGEFANVNDNLVKVADVAIATRR